MNSLPHHEAEIAAPNYTLVTTAERFNDMLEHLMSASRLAIDIEADSLYHYFEKVCLIQISSDSHTYILDPLAIDRVGELAPLMSNRLVVRTPRADISFSPTTVFLSPAFSTRISPLNCWATSSLGLSTDGGAAGSASLKRRQRDDWSQPLAPEQLEYAAWIRIICSAQRRPGGGSAAEEPARLGPGGFKRRGYRRPEKEFDTEDFPDQGHRELAAGQMARALAVIKSRENGRAFQSNNSTLLDLVHASAFRKKCSAGAAIPPCRQKNTRQASFKSRQSPAGFVGPGPPARNNWKAPGRAARLRLEALKTWRIEKAKALSLPIGVVFPAHLLEPLAISPPADLDEFARLPEMRRWRVHEFGEEVIRLLQRQELPISSR